LVHDIHGQGIDGKITRPQVLSDTLPPPIRQVKGPDRPIHFLDDTPGAMLKVKQYECTFDAAGQLTGQGNAPAVDREVKVSPVTAQIIITDSPSYQKNAAAAFLERFTEQG
jgi:hypothetical protein